MQQDARSPNLETGWCTAISGDDNQACHRAHAERAARGNPTNVTRGAAKDFAHRAAALLHAQRLERIDAGRAARGNPAREERHANHEHRHER